MRPGTPKAGSMDQRKKSFLEIYRQYGNITTAAEMAGLHRSTHYLWLKDDPEYAAAFDQATEEASERLEQEAWRRAVKGVEKPVYQGGKRVGTIQEYSDTLLIFLLKGAKPSKYKERVSQEVSGSLNIAAKLEDYFKS